jgi:type IV pilus assembly protein PilC
MTIDELHLVGVTSPSSDEPPPKPSVFQRIAHFEITPEKVPRRELMHFSRQLAVFITAGIPILEALDSITEEMGNKKFRAVLADMGQRLQSGSTFADSAAMHPEAFPDFYVGILRSAELTGSLDEVLVQLSDYIERELAARRRITGALTYPFAVLGLSVVVVIVLTAFVLPRFETFFTSLNAKLPLATRILLDIAHFITHRWYVIVGVLLVFVLTGVLASTTARGRSMRDGVLLRTPVVGDLIRFAVLERFCRILSSMVSSGVPLPDALAVTTDAVHNAVYHRGLVTVREAMVRGEGLASPLAATSLFPAAARQMFKVGEATGTLDTQLKTAATFFDRELEFKLKRFTDLFEPAVIIFVGIVVGFVAVALVSAMYGIFRQVQV